MDKLETAKRDSIAMATDIWGSSAGAYGFLFDAGVAYQGEWTAVETLPSDEGKYLVAIWNYNVSKADYGLQRFRNGNFEGAEYSHIRIVAWRDIPKYQPDGGEGE